RGTQTRPDEPVRNYTIQIPGRRDRRRRDWKAGLRTCHPARDWPKTGHLISHKEAQKTQKTFCDFCAFLWLIQNPQSASLQFESWKCADFNAFDGSANAKIVMDVLAQALNDAVGNAVDFHLQPQLAHLAFAVDFNCKLDDLRVTPHDIFDCTGENINTANRDHVIDAAQHSSD